MTIMSLTFRAASWFHAMTEADNPMIEGRFDLSGCLCGYSKEKLKNWKQYKHLRNEGLPFTNAFSAIQSVHSRHLDVHQNQVVTGGQGTFS